MTHFRCLSVIHDDVILEYLAGLLSNLKEEAEEGDEESFDEFIDVLTGYIPEFSQFDRFKLHAYDIITQHSSFSQSVGNSKVFAAARLIYFVCKMRLTDASRNCKKKNIYIYIHRLCYTPLQACMRY